MERLSNKLLEKIDLTVIDFCNENEVEVKYSPKSLGERFGFYGRFQYLIMDCEIYLTMHKDTYKSFEYYLGMEYEKDCINVKIENDSKVIVFYEDCERLLKILDGGE